MSDEMWSAPSKAELLIFMKVGARNQEVAYNSEVGKFATKICGAGPFNISLNDSLNYWL